MRLAAVVSVSALLIVVGAINLVLALALGRAPGVDRSGPGLLALLALGILGAGIVMAMHV